MSDAPQHHLGHRLAGWVDGELPPGTRQLVAAHLAMCSTCRVAAVKESRTKAGLRDLGGPAPSQDLMASLLSMPGASPPVPRAPSTQSSGSAFPTAPPRRRSGVAAPLLAAGVASVAALTVASAWLAGDGAPLPGENRVQQASIGGAIDGLPDGLPDGRPAASFASFSRPAGVGEPQFVEVLRLR